MTVEIIEGDLLDAFDRGEVNVIGHVVNCQGKMSSGIAKSIRERYPDVYESYYNIDWHTMFGGAQEVITKDEGSIVNLFAQYNYGYDGKKYLNYGALGQALLEMQSVCQYHDIIGFPYKMGSDRAGGDWDIVLEMIEYYFKDHQVKVYRLP
jgi:hypothetical protein